MFELLRQWLLGVTCAAMLTALAQRLAPSGGAGRVVRLAGGLVLMLAVLSPLLRLDSGALTRALTRYRLEVEDYREELESDNLERMKDIIEEQSAAYIQDKAARMGISCTVEVSASGTGEWPVPELVTVTGPLTGEQQRELTEQIELDFAIPAERQYYESGGGA